MIRITFITGAGKLARQKYDDNAAKTVSSTLKELGYVEDRGASCVDECAGMFKLQHDTGKNLKTIVVFPMMAMAANNNIGDQGDGTDLNQKMGYLSLLVEGSPKEMIAMSSSMNTFERMIKNKCPSWNQKRSCLAIITDLKSMLESLDGKLLHGSVLTDSEQGFYDSISMDSLEQKATYVKDEMKKHVDEGNITKMEKEKLITQAKEKIDNLKIDIDQATSENKPKKVEKLSMQRQKLVDRLASLEGITPVPPIPLKHQAEILKLCKEMQPLLKLEKETKGRLLTIKETTTLARKDEIEAEILNLEENSRGWFEEDEEFQLRVNANRAKTITAASTKTKVKKASGASSGVRKPITNWIVPGAGKKQTPKKTATKATATNAFAAMMDSDSDSD